MNKNLWGVFAGICLLAASIVTPIPASAQMSEVKEKPPMYSYVSLWNIPRGQWGDMAKADAADQSILDKAVASGSLVGYGNDVNLVHQPDGFTHDEWWSSMSMAGLMNVLDQFYSSGSAVTPVLASATKHSDAIYVSRYYNWHSGSWKGAYTHGSSYKLKADAPDDAVDKLSKNFIAPLMEKLLADGTLHEYEIDTEAVHTEAPGTFWIFYITANAEGLDKVNAALRETMKANPMNGPAFGSMVDFTPHRDNLVRTNATYK
ncbi:MAG: hypothetical protein WAU58_10015 [Terriglobales bacterium]